MYIDGIECVVDTESQSETFILCKTGEKTNTESTEISFKIHIEGKGYVDVGEFRFRYILLWSDPATWGQITPIAGDDVFIP